MSMQLMGISVIKEDRLLKAVLCRAEEKFRNGHIVGLNEVIISPIELFKRLQKCESPATANKICVKTGAERLLQLKNEKLTMFTLVMQEDQNGLKSFT